MRVDSHMGPNTTDHTDDCLAFYDETFIACVPSNTLKCELVFEKRDQKQDKLEHFHSQSSKQLFDSFV